MESANKIIKQTKKKFMIFSIIGVIAVIVISSFALNSHLQIIAKQSSMQKLYLKLNTHFALISDIALFSERFDNQFLDGQKRSEIISKFSELIQKLEMQNAAFLKWLSTQKFQNSEFAKSHRVQEQTILFVEKAKELIDNQKETPTQLRRKIRAITYNSREGIGEAINLLSANLASEQEQSLNKLKRMGLFVVILCVLQIFLVWLLVFKPLYNTIFLQHQKLVGALLTAESASRSKTDFLANISHEIRTPMTAIMGYSDLLRKDALDKQDKDDAIRTIDQNAAHLLSLIDEILDISKIEAGKFDFELEKVNLSSLLNEVYSLIHVKAVEKNIELNFKNKGSIPSFIESDSKRLKQILFNIIGNAIKFTDYGSIDLTVSTNIKTNQLVILVKDTGRGISKQQQRKLFKPFEQGDNSAKRQYGGTGLGLVLSKGLAQGMNGDINIIKSQVNVGTTFEILIDMGEVDKGDFVSTFSTHISQEQEAKTLNPSLLEGKTILVVDDAKENARLFKMYLVEAGAKIEIANDGQEALDKALSIDFDLMLLDLQMPGKDGFQVIKELKEKSYKKPIVALTAHAMKEERDKTRNAGFDGHITKPVKADFLVESVAKTINNHQNLT